MPLFIQRENYQRLRRAFAEGLPERLVRVAGVLQALAEGRRDLVAEDVAHSLVHGIIGTAATFGFVELSERIRPLAGVLKRLLDNTARPTPEVMAWLASHLAELGQLAEAMQQEGPADAEPGDAGEEQLLGGWQVFALVDDPVLRERLRTELERRHYRFVLFEGWQALCERVRSCNPTSVLVELDALPEGEWAPLQFANRFHQLQTPVPVVALIEQDDLSHRLAAVRRGSTHCLTRPVDFFRLMRLLTPWAKERPQQPYRVMVLDDDLLMTRYYQMILESAGMEVMPLNDPTGVLEALQREDPDLLILDLYMPYCNGIELASVLRQSARHAALPILFLSAEENLGRRLSDRHLAHEDFLIKPVQPTALVWAVTEVVERARAQTNAAEHLRSTLRDLENIQFAINQHAIISTTDMAGRITFVNDKFCQISGFSPPELLGNTHRLIKSEEHPRAFFEQLWGTITQGRVWHGQIKNRRKGGGYYWVEATIVPFRDEQGRPYEYISIRTDITRQKEAEEQARSMALFAETNPAPTLRINKEGEILAANPAATAILGLQAGVNCCLKCVMSDVEKVDLARLIAREGEEQILVRLGERDYAFTLVGVAELGICHIYGNEITDLKQAQREVREAKEYAENLIESSLDMIISVDLERRIVGFNRAAERCFGYSREEVLGQPVNILYAATAHRELPRRVTDALGQFKGEVRNRRRNGEEFYSFLSSSVLYDKEGQPIGFMGISRDITEWKTAETALRASEERMRAILESTVEGIIVADEQGVIELFNPAAEKIFGYGAEEVRGQGINLLMPPDEAGQHDGHLAHFLRTGRARVIGVGREFEGRRKDGTLFPIWLAISEFHHGERRMFTGMVSDITARKKVEMELRLAKEAAEKASRAKSEFLSSMSHELRTPMNAVLGFAQLLESDPLEPLTEGQRDSVLEIMKAGRHLLDLINEVLDLAKIEAGKIQLHVEEVALRDVVAECLMLVSNLARGRAVTILPPPEGCGCDTFVVRADRTRLKQVLLNLLSNAVKYNRDGGVVNLECALLAEHKRVRVRVSDSGQGIPPEQLASIFEPFNRLGAEAGQVEGTGIGLVITKRLVEMMGGGIGLESRVGLGSTFWFELPAEELAFDAASRRGEELAALMPEEGLHDLVTLLYVEDNPANLKLVERILGRRREILLLSAPAPNLGLELAQAQLPDIILLDINLPGMSGFEMLRWLRRYPATQKIPVLAVSANAMAEDVKKGLEAGFRHYLTKPIHVQQLMDALDETIAFLHRA